MIKRDSCDKTYKGHAETISVRFSIVALLVSFSYELLHSYLPSVISIASNNALCFALKYFSLRETIIPERRRNGL